MIGPLRRFWRRLDSGTVRRACAGHGKALSASALLSVGAAIFESASLVLLTALALTATGSESARLSSLPGFRGDLGLGTLIAAMAVAILGRLLLQLAASLINARTISAVVAERRRRAVTAYLGARWLSQAETDPGHLQDLTNNFAPRVGQLVGNVIQLINRALSALIMLAVAIAVSPLAAGIIVALLLVVFALLTPLRTWIRGLAKRGSGVTLELGRHVSEVPGLVREIRTYSVTERMREFLEQPIETLRSTQVRAEAALGLGVPLFQAIALAGLTVIFSLAALLFQDDVASLGAVVLAAFRSLSYGQALQANANRITDMSGWVDRFDTSVARFDASPGVYGGRELPERPTLAFDDISFGYPNRDELALSGVSFRFEPGRAVGLVGPTGSGKTTFVALLLRLVQPTSGRYEIDGVDALDHSPESWGHGFAFVPQSPEIVGGTVRDNVRFFRQVSDEAVERALRAAHVWDEVTAMPRGLDSEIGLAGSDLSGGQRQRLALARALVGEPRVLILDEPTSALDPLSEEAIVTALDELRGRLTTITVAHRLSTLRTCDTILVLSDGQLVDSGSPEELAARPGFFASSLDAGRFESGKPPRTTG